MSQMHPSPAMVESLDQPTANHSILSVHGIAR